MNPTIIRCECGEEITLTTEQNICFNCYMIYSEEGKAFDNIDDLLTIDDDEIPSL